MTARLARHASGGLRAAVFLPMFTKVRPVRVGVGNLTNGTWWRLAGTTRLLQ